MIFHFLIVGYLFVSSLIGVDPGPAELLPGRAVSDKDGIKRAELQRLGWASRRS